MEITYQPIGTIHSPFHRLEDMPIQPASDVSRAGFIEVFPAFVDGLQDLDGFSHVYLLYHFHEVRQTKLVVTPFLDTELRGVFATRAPSRPNPIGLSLVELVRVEGNLVHVDRLDVLDGTPLLDVKPYVPEFEDPHAVRLGWLEPFKDEIRSVKSDARFKR